MRPRHVLLGIVLLASASAILLGISSRKLNYMIRKMGLTHPSWRRNRGPEPSGPSRRDSALEADDCPRLNLNSCEDSDS